MPETAPARPESDNRMLALKPPFAPMEARLVSAIPTGEEWQYEPKWDGFRCIAFRDGANVELQSKASQPLTRYFPEIVRDLSQLPAKKFVLDGEIFIAIDGMLSFDDLLQRIHPAESRVAKLSAEHPARYVIFDLLVSNRGVDLTSQPLAKRRAALDVFARRNFPKSKLCSLSPATTDLAIARHWLKSLRGQLDGLIAKRLDDLYLSSERAMRKVKNLRTADCVVGGYRNLASRSQVGSLLLGLYDSKGLLHHVGFTSSIAAKDRAALTKKLKTLVEPPGFTGRAPGGPSRWSNGRSTEWNPLRPELVVEVQYDHFTGKRFRHGTKFLRWRPDKSPEQCLIHQVAAESASPLALLKDTA